MHGMQAATSRVENSTQASSCQVKFVHDQEALDCLIKLKTKNFIMTLKGAHVENG